MLVLKFSYTKARRVCRALKCANFITLKRPTKLKEPRHEISNNVVYATSKGSDQPVHTRSLIPRPACAYAQSDQSLCKSLEYSMSVKLLTEYHLEFLCLRLYRLV